MVIFESFVGSYFLIRLVLARMLITKNVTGAIGIVTLKQKYYPRYSVVMCMIAS